METVLSRARVIVKRINAGHEQESFAVFKPLGEEITREIKRKVGEIFDNFGGGSMIKSSGDVYIKPNGIDAKPYCHTRPELVEAVIDYWFEAGAMNVFLFENSTQANYTRLVFENTGYKKVCKRTGAIPVYLDEEETVEFEFRGKTAIAEGGDPQGYELGSFRMPEILAQKLIQKRDENLYISLPKLKTHSMAGVTLGVKNQWAFPEHSCRGRDHNYNLPYKLVDVLSYLRPDFTLIEGIEGTIYGHYPVTALADKCVKSFKVLIGSRNVVAADLAGARVFGLGLDDIPHLKIAVEKGLSEGVEGINDIELEGDLPGLNNIDLIGDMPDSGKYPTDLYDSFPDDVKIIKGSTMACKEGCVNNPLTLLQVLYHDHNGRGGWDLVIGKGHDPGVIDGLKGPVLIAGHCAIEEVSERLIKRIGRKNVYLSGECNDLCSTANAMFHLTKVNPIEFCPINPLKAFVVLFIAKFKGSKSRVPNPFAHLIKTV